MAGPYIFEYSGEIYIRPLARGIVFEGMGPDGEYVEDVFARLLADREHYGSDQTCYARVRIEVERLEPPAEEA